MAMSEANKKQHASEFMMEGVREQDAATAVEVLCLFKAFRKNVQTSEAAAILAQAVWLSRHTLS